MADTPPTPDETPPAAPTAEQYEAEARARAEKLGRTMEIFHRYDWGTDLIVVDPDDLIVDRPETEEFEGNPGHPRLMKQDFEHFVDEEYVGRVLVRGEELLEAETALDLRVELNDCLDEVEDMTTPPHLVGFHVAVLSLAARRAKGARLERDEAETVSDAARDAVAAAAAADEASFDAAADAVSALGGDAWPALEAAAREDASGPAALAAVKIAPRLGGARAIRVVTDALVREPEHVGEAALASLLELGLPAGWAALGRLHFEGLSPSARRVLLEVAVTSDEPLAVTLVIHEAIQAFQGEIEGVGSDHGVALSRLLLERKDHRAVPLLAFVLKSDAFKKEAHDQLVAVLQEHGMWGEVSRVLASLKGNWPLVVPSGNSFEMFAARIAELEGIDVKDDDVRNEFVRKAEAHWLECYREELGYQRTCDADQAGPVEQSLMRLFSAEASHLAQGVSDQQKMQARIENYRETWMRTPLRRIENKMPLVAIFEERIDMQPEGMGRVRARRNLLARTLKDVKTLIDAKRPRRARLAMGVLEAMAPDYPPARRVRTALEAL